MKGHSGNSQIGWYLNNKLQNNQWAKEQSQGKLENIIKWTVKNSQDTKTYGWAKVCFKMKFMAVNADVKKKKRYKTNNLTFTRKKENKTRPKANRRKKII